MSKFVNKETTIVGIGGTLLGIGLAVGGKVAKDKLAARKEAKAKEPSNDKDKDSDKDSDKS